MIKQLDLLRVISAILFVMATLLFAQNAAHAAITYFNSASNPNDNGSLGASPVAVTPPGGMATGDLVIMVANTTIDNVTMAISASGGQTWAAQTNINTIGSQRIFWARYNGTWSADPSVSFTNTSNTTVVMHVYRPTVGTNTWAIDVAQSSAAFPNPSGSGGDVTISSINTVTDGALVFATWTSVDNNQWALQTGGWTNAGNSQYRNRQGSDGSQSSAYQVKATAGATGAVINRENSAGGNDAGNISILAFREVAPPPTVVSINCVGACVTSAGSVSWLVTFSASVTGGSASNFTLVNSGLGGTPAITSVTGTGTTRTVTASTGTGSGTLGLNMTNTTGVSPALVSLPFVGQVFTIDRTPPVVSSIVRVDPTPTALASVAWTVTFSKSVTGVDASDFALVQAGGVSGALITSVTGSGTTWTVSVSTGTGNGTLGLNLVDDDSIIDTAGNRLGGTGAGNGNFTGQVYTFVRPVTVTSDPALCVNDASIGVPTGNWTGLTNVATQNNVYAQASVANSDITNYLKCTGYGFSIPAGAVISGITVGPWLNASFTMTDNAMQLVKGNVIQPTNLATGSNIPNGGGAFAPAPTQFTYGGTNNLWGNTWTVADINSANFGAAFAAQRGGFATTQQAGVDAMPISVTYTVPPAAKVLSINRAGASPTTAAAVSWTVIFDKNVTGVDASIFTLVPTGVSGAFITSVTGSGTTWTVTANTGIGSGTLGLDQTGPGVVSPVLSGTFTGQVYTITATPALAEYRMDAASWSGMANEVVDSAGGFNGTAAGLVTRPTTSTLSPAIAGSPGTCGYGVFTRSNKDYVALPGGFPNLAAAAGSFTITAWIKTTNNTLPGQRIFIDDETNASPGGWGFSVGETTAFGAGGLRFYYRQPSVYILDTAPIPSNQWLFVALTVDLVAGANASTATIFAYNAAGVLVTSNTSTFTWTAGADPGPSSIGGETNASGEGTNAFGFSGNIDELRVYQKVLNSTALAAVRAQTRPCGSTLNHIRIEHGGVGLTCEPASMTIKACADATCATPYTGVVTTTLSPAGWVGGDTINFSGGSTTAQLRRTTLGIVALSSGTTSPVPAVATRCFNGLTETCSFEFKDTGFIFSAIPTQIAATTSATHTLQAVRTDNSTGVCTGLFNGNVPNIELASECINPGICQAGQQVTFNNNGSGTIAANNGGPIGSWTSRTLTFGANSTANFTFSYPDVGAIRLHARYNIASSGNYMSGVTTPAGGFVVKPAGFTVTGIQRTADAFANPVAGDATGTAFIKAGDPMTLTVTAVNSAGVKTPNYGKESAPEGVLLTSALVPGLGLTNNPALGNGAVAGGTFGVGVNAGIATVTNVSWSEVGIIRITPSVGDGSYLGTGDVTGTMTGNIGRFTPHNFDVTPVAPLFATACTGGSFTNVGQSFTYGLAPVMTVTARNLAGVTTLNYKGTSPAAQAFFKITNAKLAQAPYATQTNRYTRFDALGGGTTPTLDVSGLPATGADPAIVANGNGTAKLTFSAGTGLAFTRTTPVAQFNADISLAINVIDTDDVIYASNPARFGTATAGSGIAFSAGKDMRFGRLRLGNVSGSQLLPLEVPVETQYWRGTFFVTNVDDSCTALATGKVGLGKYIGNINAGDTTVTAVTGTLSSGRGTITLSAPGAGNDGSVDVTVNLGASPAANADACALAPAATAGNQTYLRGLWCTPPGTYTKDPDARARFGIRGGGDERIYMRENY